MNETNLKPIVSELSALDRARLEAHFLALDPEDRRLRFGIPLSAAAIGDYVSRIDFTRDAVFGVFDDDMRLLCAAHVARGADHAELGVSVLPSHRGRGLGGAMLGRAHTHARNWGVDSLFMHCLAENGAMMHLARTRGMKIVAADGDADAWLKLPPADASSHFDALLERHFARLDRTLKEGLGNVRRVVAGRAQPAR